MIRFKTFPDGEWSDERELSQTPLVPRLGELVYLGGRALRVVHVIWQYAERGSLSYQAGDYVTVEVLCEETVGPWPD